MKKKLDLKDIVLIGRMFDEYCSMFDLFALDPAKENILDVASGVSSFCAEATSRGYTVTASDKIYDFNAEEIEQMCIRDLANVFEQMPGVIDMYSWEYFKDITDWKRNREKAYTLFIRDIRAKGNDKYIYADYPDSDFADNEFTRSLVSHFLFVYDEYLDYDFHKETIQELIRITSDEIRIFPIINLEGQRSSFVNELLNDFDFRDYDIRITKVDYEFVKNGNEMLSIRMP